MERDPVKMVELLLALPEGVRVLGVERWPDVVRIELESTLEESRCPRCGTEAVLTGAKTDELVDLPVMGSPSRFLVRRRRWRCPSASCPVTKWVEKSPVEAEGLT